VAGGIGTVGVVGLGTMGAGIVEVFARAGLPVTALEIDDAALERGRAALHRSTGRAVSRGKLTAEQAAELLSRITFSTSYEALSTVDLVVEAAPERMSVKRQVFTELDRVCAPRAILATNTSSLSVTEVAHQTKRPGRVVGLHFFNPAPVMKLVEVIGTLSTDPEVVTAVRELCATLGKVAVAVSDRAGFVANYLLLGYLNQAAWLHQDGGVGRDDLDEAMRLGAGLPMGPLTLMDLIGIDTIVEILDVIHAGAGASRRHAAAPLLRRLVAAGRLGRKTGRGFYTYDKPGSGRVTDAEPETQPVPVLSGPVAVVGDPAAAEAFEAAGVPVIRLDSADLMVPTGPTDPDALSNLERVAGRAGASAEQVEAAVQRVLAGVGVSAVDLLGAVDLVVAGQDVPPDLFAKLDAAVKPAAVLAVNSSTAPVLERALATEQPARVVGLHLVGELVEVTRTVLASGAAVRAGQGAAAALGRWSVVVAERAGLVVDALLVPYLNDAVSMLATGYADADGIDHAMTLGCGYPEGPIAMADRLGLPAVLRIAEALHRETGEPSLAPAPLLAQLAAAGRGLRDSAAVGPS
jgi:3-hydroxybutyryl-CoA dehydrogenase